MTVRIAMSAIKIAKWLRQEACLRFRPLTLPSKLAYVHIETSTRCNFRCKFCPIVQRSERLGAGFGSQAFMSLDVFKTILDRIPLEGVESLGIQGYGEVMLNPDFLAIAKYAKTKGVPVSFNSNMSLLTPEIAEALVQCQFDEVDFSIDAAEPELFSTLRPGIPLPKLLENLTVLNRIKAAYRSSKPYLGFRVVVSKQNRACLEPILYLAQNYGAKRVFLQDLQGDDRNELIKVNRLDQMEYVTLKRESQRYWSRREYKFPVVLTNFKRFEERPPGVTRCNAPWQEIFVTIDGYVTPCCMIDDPAVLNHSSLLESRFEDIWNGRAYRAFRRALRSGRPGPCQSCTNY